MRKDLIKEREQECSITNFPGYPAAYHQFINDTPATTSTNDIQIKCNNTDLFYLGESEHFYRTNYFCPDRKEIALSKHNAGMTSWLNCFIHESCHTDQWIQDRKFWNRNISSVAPYFDSLSDKSSLSKRDREKYTRNMINLELDCEKRTIEKIKKYDLPVDIKQYTKRANAYVYGIVYAGKVQQYIPFYYTHEIAPLFPGEFQNCYQLDSLRKELFVAFFKYSLRELN